MALLGSDRILALDIGAATVKIAEFQAVKPSGLRLTNFNYADLGSEAENEAGRKGMIVSTIRNVLREKGIKSSRVIFSVSGQSVFTRFVKLPPVDESKVIQIIQYEAQQNVPFPIDEVIWDYQLIGSNAAGELEVVLLAIKSDIIEDLNDAVESAGLRTEIVDVAPMALYNAVRFNYGDMEGCTMVIDIGARTTNLLFLEQNRIFSRSIPFAGNAITQNIATEFNISFQEAEQLKKSKGFVALGGAYEEPEDEEQARVSKIIRNVMTRLHADITRSINFYRSQQGGSAPARVLLSGGSAILPYTNRFFEEKVPVPVEYFNPFRNVDIDPTLTRDDLAKCAHFFGEVVGLGLRRFTECPIEVNLIPRTIRSRQVLERKRPYFIGAALCVLLVPVCWLAYTKETARLKDRELQEVSRLVTQFQNMDKNVALEKTQLDELVAKGDKFSEMVKQRSVWVSFMQDINSRVVSNLWVTSLVPQAIESGPNLANPAAPYVPMVGRGVPVPSRPPGPAGTAPAAAPGRLYSEVLITGAGNHFLADPEQDLKLVNEFVKNLRESKFLEEKNGVEILELPNILTREPTFTYKLLARLAKDKPM